MKTSPVVWQARPAAPHTNASPPRAPHFTSITIMLTEFCNLDCWMCDFAVSKGLKETLTWTPQQYVTFLRHNYFRDLQAIGFTGGEPFAFAGIQNLYRTLQDEFPAMFISFSSNATLLKPMSETLALTRHWKQTRLFTSIDGVATHDVQRGKPGALDKSMKHLQMMRTQFPELAIDVKFTITPVNCLELRDAYLLCTERGFNFTAKMIENNPFYTNALSYAQHLEDFQFTQAQTEAVREQLAWIIDNPAPCVALNRRSEMREVLESLDPAWRRSGHCRAPSESAFLDARLNFFGCKEYPPLLNLASASLDELTGALPYRQAIESEACNAGVCARCTSQLKKPKAKSRWTSWLSS